MSAHPTPPDPVEETPVDAPNLSRARFLRRGTTGGLVLVVGGTALAAAACGDDDSGSGATTTAASTAAAPVDDAAIGALAATAELLAIDFYSQAIDSGLFKADQLAYMQAARMNEQDHYDALAEVLGADAPKDLTFMYPDGTFASAGSIAETGIALETAFVGAYMGAVPALSDNGLRKVAAQIGANEAQHLTVLNSIGADGALVPNPSLPEVLTAEEATAAVTPFLG